MSLPSRRRARHGVAAAPRHRLWSRRSCVAYSALLLALIAGALQAQASDPVRAVDSISRAAAVAQLPRLGFAIPHADGTAPYETLTWLSRGDRYASVQLLTPWTMAALPPADTVLAHVRNCIARWPDHALEHLARPWAPLDSATADRAYVLLQVDVRVVPISPCLSATEAALRIASVQLVGSPAKPKPTNDLVGAAVTSSGRLIAPTIAARERAVILDAAGRSPLDPPHDLRVYLSPDELPPDAHGRFHDAVVWLTTRDSMRVPDSVAVAASDIAAAWSDLTPWRLARLRGRPHDTNLPRLRAPDDSALRRAAGLYAAGDLLDAATLAAHRRAKLFPGGARGTDSRYADLAVGSVFLAYGDSSAARAAYARALESAPCLRFAAHPAYDVILDQVRPAGTRCSSISTAREVAAGLVFPGGAQWARHDWLGATVVAIVTGTLSIEAAGQHANAQRQFDAYRSAVGPAPVAWMLDRANDSQHAARRLAIEAGEVWAASTVIGVVQERVHAWRVRRQQEYEPLSSSGARR